MYFERFAGVRATVLFSMSHTKPMNTGAEEKGVSLEGSQGIPKRSDIWFMYVFKVIGVCDDLIAWTPLRWIPDQVGAVLSELFVRTISQDVTFEPPATIFLYSSPVVGDGSSF